MFSTFTQETSCHVSDFVPSLVNNLLTHDCVYVHSISWGRDTNMKNRNVTEVL